MLQNVSIISFASFIIFSSALILQNLFFSGHYGITIDLKNGFKMRNEVSRAFEEETIKRAESGNQEAALFALELAIREIEHSYEKSKIIDYFVSKVRLFLDNGVSLERALGIHSNSKDGGRPKKYDPTEVAAVDLLLRDHAGFKPEQAIEWIEINVGADRRFVQLRRKEYDARYNDFGAKKLMESRPVDDLLELAGSLREKVGGVLPQT